MRQIVAMGGGGFLMGDPVLDRFLLSLTDSRRPRICFLPTASGDHPGGDAAFHEAFPDAGFEASILRLFDRDVADIGAFLGDQDVVYVGGGNTVSMLAVWRAHGVDAALRAAGESGVILAGVSAGANCWFEACTTDSFQLGRADPLARRPRAGRGLVHPALRRRGGAPPGRAHPGRRRRPARRSRLRRFRRAAHRGRLGVPGRRLAPVGARVPGGASGRRRRRGAVGRAAPSVSADTPSACEPVAFATMNEPVQLGEPIDLADVARVALGAPVALGDGARDRIRAARARDRARRRRRRHDVRRDDGVRLAGGHADRPRAGLGVATRHRDVARDGRGSGPRAGGGAGDAAAARARARAGLLGRARRAGRADGRDAEPRRDPGGARTGFARRLGRSRAARQSRAAADRPRPDPDRVRHGAAPSERSHGPGSRRSSSRPRRASRS